MARKVAILSDFPLSSLDGVVNGRGGGQGCTWLPQLSEAFAGENDLDLHWLVLDRQVRRVETQRARGQSFHRVPAVSMSLDLAFDYRFARSRFARALRELVPDVVHAWGCESRNPSVLRDWRGPSILSMQGILSELDALGLLARDWRWRRMVEKERVHLERATIVTVESRWGMNRLRQMNPGLDLRQVEYGVHSSFYKTQWCPSPDDPRILYVGGVGRGKGFDILLDALDLLGDQGWRVRLAGHAELGDQAAARGLRGCKGLGLLKWDQLREELSKAWCLVFPTRCDTSPNVVKEARVVGLPVVTSLHGGQTDYIADDENGRLVDPLDAASLAEAIRRSMMSFERVLEMGATHHARDRTYFEPSQTASKFAELYRELAS